MEPDRAWSAVVAEGWDVGIGTGWEVRDERWEWGYEWDGGWGEFGLGVWWCDKCSPCGWYDEESDGEAFPDRRRDATDASRLRLPRVMSRDGREEDDGASLSREGAMLVTPPAITPDVAPPTLRELMFDDDRWRRDGVGC